MPGIALGNIVTSVTRDKFFPQVIDNIFTGNALWERLRGKARPWTGGYRLTLPTTVSNRTNGGSYSGFDTFITTQEDVRQQFTVNPSEYYWNVTVSGIQKAVQKGPEAIIDLIAAEFQDVGRNLAEKLGADTYLDGTSNSSKAIAGLNYHIDDATDVTTYQGLSRNTYTNLRATRTAQSGALAFSALASDYDAAQRGKDTPTLGLTTPAVWTIIEALITPVNNVNINQAYPRLATTGGTDGVSASYGYNSIYYRGVPIIADEMCTAANLWFLNENHLFLYTIDHDPMFVDGTKEGFGWTGWKKSQNQNVIVGQLLWAGQLVGTSPRTMSRRTGITS
jgi:hypothetical protein